MIIRMQYTYCTLQGAKIREIKMVGGFIWKNDWCFFPQYYIKQTYNEYMQRNKIHINTYQQKNNHLSVKILTIFFFFSLTFFQHSKHSEIFVHHLTLISHTAKTMQKRFYTRGTLRRILISRLVKIPTLYCEWLRSLKLDQD